MNGCRVFRTLAVLVSMLVLAGRLPAAETWMLGEGEQWQEVSQSSHGRYLLAVSKVKKLVNQGKVHELDEAIEKLKQNFPEVAGADFDEFLKAEKYYAAGKFTKAVRSYDSFLARYPESPLYEAALDRELSIARAYLSGQKKTVLKFLKIKGYAEGVKIADKIIDRAGDLPLAVSASVAVAESYEQRGKYEDAYQRWSMIASRWPTGEIGKKALLGMARCKHAAYKGPKYDVSDLASAKSYYENFLIRYPEEAQKYEVEKRIEQITEQLAYKEYSIAQYYQRTGSEEAAEFYCEMILDKWPDSTGAKRARNIVTENEDSQNEEEKK